jgi:putative transposase
MPGDPYQAGKQSGLGDCLLPYLHDPDGSCNLLIFVKKRRRAGRVVGSCGSRLARAGGAVVREQPASGRGAACDRCIGLRMLDRQSWRTRIELANAIFEYLEIWHNRRRRHSALGWRSPLEFENQSKIVVA